MARLRVGIVPYLNASPLVYPLVTREIEHDFTLVEDAPSRLADALGRGELDIALMPAIEYALGQDYRIVPDIAISTRGAVMSVLLYTQKTPPHIHRVALDESSRTSAALVKILLPACFGIRPEYISRPPRLGNMLAEADAALLIGDQALLASQEDYHCLDLGALWQARTGMGFVFALFVVRPGVDAHQAVETLRKAKFWGISQIPKIAQAASARLGLSVEVCLDYLQRCIHYDLQEEQQKALQRFYQMACAEGLIPQEVPLRFYR